MFIATHLQLSQLESAVKEHSSDMEQKLLFLQEATERSERELSERNKQVCSPPSGFPHSWKSWKKSCNFKIPLKPFSKLIESFGEVMKYIVL